MRLVAIILRLNSNSAMRTILMRQNRPDQLLESCNHLESVKMPELKLIVLKTTQPDALRGFYTQLGFQFVEEQHGKGPVHFSAALGDGILEIYPLSGGVEADQTTRLGFAVSDLESIVECLDEAHVRSKPEANRMGAESSRS